MHKWPRRAKNESDMIELQLRQLPQQLLVLGDAPGF